jgi:hypothetical protein
MTANPVCGQLQMQMQNPATTRMIGICVAPNQASTLLAASA